MGTNGWHLWVALMDTNGWHRWALGMDGHCGVVLGGLPWWSSVAIRGGAALINNQRKPPLSGEPPIGSPLLTSVRSE